MWSEPSVEQARPRRRAFAGKGVGVPPLLFWVGRHEAAACGRGLFACAHLGLCVYGWTLVRAHATSTSAQRQKQVCVVASLHTWRAELAWVSGHMILALLAAALAGNFAGTLRRIRTIALRKSPGIP